MPPPPPNEHHLLQRAQTGDPEAIGLLYQSHVAAIYRYFWLRLNDPLQAEDLTSEVFTKMLEGLAQYQARGLPFGAWLFRIAHARYVDYVRRAQVRQTDPLLDTLPAEAPALDTHLLTAAQTQELRLALATLTEEQQRVIQLRFIESLSLEETARRLHKSVGAVKALQHRALQNLAQRLPPE